MIYNKKLFLYRDNFSDFRNKKKYLRRCWVYSRATLSKGLRNAACHSEALWARARLRRVYFAKIGKSGEILPLHDALKTAQIIEALTKYFRCVKLNKRRVVQICTLSGIGLILNYNSVRNGNIYCFNVYEFNFFLPSTSENYCSFA